MRNQIKQLIKSIKPFDETEKKNISDIIEWIDSGEELFRIEKPATPPKHLVSYFVLIDQENKKVMLVDHIKAELWLPSGGHVEKDEHPNVTVERELEEELFMKADFILNEPVFVTQTVTVGKTAGHTDISLWYVVRANSTKEIQFDPGEFNGYKWFTVEDILSTNISQFDPHMHRFTEKIIAEKLL